MIDILKISIIFVFILLLLRKKWNVGYVLLASSLLLSIFYRMPPLVTIKGAFLTITSPVTMQLLIALTFIRMFELILREKNVLNSMMDFVKGVLRNKKSVIVSMPLLIGMLPSVGGAYFSAPMVEEASKGLNISSEDKSFTNYWYRHPWEFVLPLYPGIILMSVITNIELRSLIFLNAGCAVTMLLVGVFIGIKDIDGKFPGHKKILQKGMYSFLPIILLLVLVIGFGMSLHYALVLSVVLLVIFYLYDLQSIIKVLKHGFSKDIIILIAGVMMFKEFFEISGAVGNLVKFFSANEVPLFPILFLLPFVCGVLTGITIGFVGATFPLILSLTNDPAALSFAFAAGYAGVLVSPVHVCLILTREYFDAHMWGVYRRIIPAVLCVLLVAVVQYFVLVQKF